MYLRAAAATSDPVPNKEAWDLLEGAAKLDPTYAPIWAQIARRAYYAYSYGSAGEEAVARAQEAARHALDLDPNLVEAATRLIVMRTEGGQTVAAYRDAKELVRRRPDSSEAHLALSYVLRYGGALDEAARECNAALGLDSGNRNLRSCAMVFAFVGDTRRARDFAQLDAGSNWNSNMMGLIQLREGKAVDAPGDPLQHMIALCGRNAPAPEIDRLMQQALPGLERQGKRDGEPLYVLATALAYCGHNTEALRYMRESLRHNYCTWPAIDRDPSLASFRTTPEYRTFRPEAEACSARFLAERIPSNVINAGDGRHEHPTHARGPDHPGGMELDVFSTIRSSVSRWSSSTRSRVFSVTGGRRPASTSSTSTSIGSSRRAI